MAGALDALWRPLCDAGDPRAFGTALRGALGALARPADQAARDAAEDVRAAIDELEATPPALLEGLAGRRGRGDAAAVSTSVGVGTRGRERP